MREQQQREFIRALTARFADEPDDARIALGSIAEETDLAACFLGPKAENADILRALVARAVDGQAEWREKDVHPRDPAFITPEMKDEPSFKATEARLVREFEQMLQDLRKHSTPFFSMRHQGHMLWDMTLPGMAGYFGAMLFNQNNVAVEASPVTTMMEMQVGEDMCHMLGLDRDASGDVKPWGHITCDGSVANIESLWMARNLKFYAAAVQRVLEQPPSGWPRSAVEIGVRPYDRPATRLIDLDPWAVLNLPIGEVLSLPARLKSAGVDPEVLQAAVLPWTVQALGMAGAYTTYLAPYGLNPPVFIVPATKHYSWTKAGLVLGIGSNQMLEVQVDLDARAYVTRASKPAGGGDIRSVEDFLDACFATNGRRTPVMSCISILGSTEENAIDPLQPLLDLRERYRRVGCEFVVHVDAAWGGYFASMFRAPASQAALEAFIPTLPLSDYVSAQYAALPRVDSVTIDPHKSGYIPYPAGGLCYRDSRMCDLVALSSPVIHREAEPTVGIYGIEGSKPGAAAAAVYLSHRVIPADITGYGKILGQCHFTNKKLYARLVTMARPDDPFVFVPLQRLPAEREGRPPREVQEELARIRRAFVGKSNEEIVNDPEDFELFRKLGSDGVIITYAFNFRNPDGRLNADIGAANAFNARLFEQMSYQPKTELNAPPLIVTSSQFTARDYGVDFIASFQSRLGCRPDPAQGVYFLISTQMNPWITETSTDKVDGFLATIEAELRRVVCANIPRPPATPGYPSLSGEATAAV